ncbi:MAG TPA: methyltransferase domain-containing protein [Alphaproteobacteria bacterium]
MDLIPAVSRDRWTAAQAAELSYWRSLDLREILRICAEKPEFLALLDDPAQCQLFAGKDVLEIGCGPLGLSVVSFSRHKPALRRLVKAEPLPRLSLRETRLVDDAWAAPFLDWVETLAGEGEYVQTPGEDLGFEACFDTVVTYNVLDHVREPMTILRNAARALRPGGKLLVGVDCLSVVGRWRFETLTRRTHRGTILVEAHPHTFLPDTVGRMIGAAGFRINAMLGVPGVLRRWIGSHSRPAFVATKA